VSVLKGIVDELAREYGREAPPRMRGFSSQHSKVEVLIHDWTDQGIVVEEARRVLQTIETVGDGVDKATLFKDLEQALAVLDTGREERGLT
jgi:hypothetical protein